MKRVSCREAPQNRQTVWRGKSSRAARHGRKKTHISLVHSKRLVPSLNKSPEEFFHSNPRNANTSRPRILRAGTEDAKLDAPLDQADENAGWANM